MVANARSHRPAGHIFRHHCAPRPLRLSGPVIGLLSALQVMNDCRYAHRALAGSACHLGNVGLDARLDYVMEANAAEAAALLRLLGSERRLMLLCLMIVEGEAQPLGRRVGRRLPFARARGPRRRRCA